MTPDQMRFGACFVISATFWTLACAEATGAQEMHRRTGRWHGHRVAAVVICAALAALFTGLAFT